MNTVTNVFLMITLFTIALDSFIRIGDRIAKQKKENRQYKVETKTEEINIEIEDDKITIYKEK